METLTKPQIFEADNRTARVGGHSTIHTNAVVSEAYDSDFDAYDYDAPTQELYDLQHLPVAAIETSDLPVGPHKHAGKIAVALGLGIVLAGTAAAFTNVLDLVRNPPSLSDIVEHDPVEELAVEDIVEEEPVEEVGTTTATAISGARIRSAPSQNASPIGSISAGDTVAVTGDPQDGWYPVEYEGVTGWTWGQLLGNLTTADGTTIAVAEPAPMHEPMIITRRVHLRTGPSTQTASQGMIDVGDHVEMTGPVQHGWVPIIHNGQAGYVMRENLRQAH